MHNSPAPYNPNWRGTGIQPIRELAKTRRPFRDDGPNPASLPSELDRRNMRTDCPFHLPVPKDRQNTNVSPTAVPVWVAPDCDRWLKHAAWIVGGCVAIVVE